MILRDSDGTPREAADVSLIITDPNGRSTSLRVKPGNYLIGRSKKCQIRFPPKTRAVSRQHARLAVNADAVKVEDLESNTGTMVNGRIIRVAVLQSQDVISIAGYNLKVILQEEDDELAGLPSSLYTARSAITDRESTDDLIAGLRQLRQASAQVMRALATRIVGQRATLRFIWASILAKGHCLLIGVPGLAKTLMVSTFGEVLGLQNRRIQFTPDLLPSDITGSNILHESEEGTRYFEFVQGPVFTQLLLADEINRAPPKTQSALLEAMQERQVTVANKSYSLPEPFFVIATQNPIEQEGTYPLPEAQQDRFMLCLCLDYPTREEEIDILVRANAGGEPELREVLSFKDILRFQELAQRIVISRELATYCADIARATRPADPRSPAWLRDVVEWGAGPRAGQALIRIAKATAAMAGRPYVTAEDIRDALLPVMRHRIFCNFRARAGGFDPAAIIDRLAREVPCK